MINVSIKFEQLADEIETKLKYRVKFVNKDAFRVYPPIEHVFYELDRYDKDRFGFDILHDPDMNFLGYTSGLNNESVVLVVLLANQYIIEHNGFFETHWYEFETSHRFLDYLNHSLKIAIPTEAINGHSFPIYTLLIVNHRKPSGDVSNIKEISFIDRKQAQKHFEKLKAKGKDVSLVQTPVVNREGSLFINEMVTVCEATKSRVVSGRGCVIFTRE